MTGTDEKREPVPATEDSWSPPPVWPNPTLVMALRLARPEQAVDLFRHTPARIHAYLQARHWECRRVGRIASVWQHPTLSDRFPDPGFDDLVVPDTHPSDLDPDDAALADRYRRQVGAVVVKLADVYGTGELAILLGIMQTEVP